MGGLEDARLLLKPANVLRDVVYICGSHAFDLRHVAEFPMVGPHPVGRSPLESRIPVVIGFVDLMDQRRTLRSAGPLFSVADGTIGVELGLARLQVRGERRASGCGGRLRGIAGCRDEQDDAQTPPPSETGYPIPLHRPAPGPRSAASAWPNCSRSMACVRRKVIRR